MQLHLHSPMRLYDMLSMLFSHVHGLGDNLFRLLINVPRNSPWNHKPGPSVARLRAATHDAAELRISSYLSTITELSTLNDG
jgi:hypothetical protein